MKIVTLIEDQNRFAWNLERSTHTYSPKRQRRSLTPVLRENHSKTGYQIIISYLPFLNIGAKFPNNEHFLLKT